MSPSSRDSNLGPYRLFLRFLTARAGDRTPVPSGEPNSEASTCQVQWEANQVLIQGLDPEGQCHFILGLCPVTETHSSRESWGRGHHNLPIALPRESPRTFYSIQGQCVRHSPSPCQRYFFGLETCAELLAQTLYFIDVCTRKHESMIFPLSYTHWTMYIFLLSKEVHSLKNII